MNTENLKSIEMNSFSEHFTLFSNYEDQNQTFLSANISLEGEKNWVI